MKKVNYIKTALALLLTVSVFSSCLKDSATTVDFSKGGQSAEIPLSGLNNFGNDAITSDTAEVSFGVNINGSTTLSRAQDITVDVDAAKIAAYNAANPAIVYEAMPANAYTFKTTVVNIPAGGRYKILSFTIYKNVLDPSKSYMLPIGITKADGLTISANQSTKYYHVIGNDFAGAYHHAFIRTPAGGDFADRPSTFSPDSPTQFEVAGGYYTQDIRYVVSFSKSGSGTSATYSNFKISLNATDVARIALVPITISTQPTIVGYDASKSYSFAQALQLFANGFTYGANGTRLNLDKYTK